MKKLFQRFILDSLISKTPFTYVFIFVFGAVFCIGFYCGHWIEGINLSSIKFYDVTTNNIGGYSSLGKMNDLLPIDIVYTWVNGSDPFVLENIRRLSELEKFICTHANCYSSPYYASEAANSLDEFHTKDFKLLQISEVSKGVLKKKFKIYQTNGKKELNNSSTVHQAYWTSDEKVDWAIVWKRGLIIQLSRDSQINVEISNISPQNYESFVKNCSVVQHSSVFIVDCVHQSLVESLKKDIDVDKIKRKSRFIKVWEAYLILHTDISSPNLENSRFDDNEELRYSLRSVEKFAPWARQIFLVTNGQIPHWLNLDHQRLTIVTHEQIFRDSSHLPTFSSPAIESNIHRIPGLSKHFLYINDDIMLGDYVWPEDFFSLSSGYKVYLSWSLPECSSGCPSSWINDGYCDHTCNTSSCNWDGGDCNRSKEDLAEKERTYDAYGDSDIFMEEAEFCSSTCSDEWLADSYCDTACSSLPCGFDAGDCGLEVIRENMHQLSFDPRHLQNRTLTMPKGTLSAWIDLQPVMKAFKNVTANHSPVKGVRSVSLNVPLEALIIVFKPNVSSTIDVFLEFGRDGKEERNRKVHFNIKFNTYPVNPLEKNVENTLSKNESFPIENYSFENLSPRILNMSFALHLNNSNSEKEVPMDIVQKIKILHDQYVNGELTEQGFKWKKNSLVHSSVPSKENIESNFNGSRRLLSIQDDAILRRLNGHFPWERNQKLLPLLEERPNVKTGRKLLDAFGDSLLYVNRLYNHEYGFQSRKVPAHMPIFINKDILQELQDKYEDEFYLTSSHKVRQRDDMQFAFSYFYYIMSEKRQQTIAQMFDELDTDKSGTWSDREIRTFLSKSNPLPLLFKFFNELHEDIRNCTDRVNPQPVPTPSYERYSDSNLPTVSKELVTKCNGSRLWQKMDKIKSVPKYQTTTLSDSVVHFKMITSNVSIVVYHLDEIRKNTRKFICMNNNLDSKSSENELVRALVQDTYESLYPIPSSFELPLNYRNRFLYVWELQAWRRYKSLIRSLIYAFISCLIVLSLSAFFGAEIDSLKRRWCKRRRKEVSII